MPVQGREKELFDQICDKYQAEIRVKISCANQTRDI